MRFVYLALIVVGLLVSVGCTENIRAKSFGGSMTTALPACRKLVNITWKDGNLWYLTRPWRVGGDFPESYTFSEVSAYGVFEGAVEVKETCPAEIPK